MQRMSDERVRALLRRMRDRVSEPEPRVPLAVEDEFDEGDLPDEIDAGLADGDQDPAVDDDVDERVRIAAPVNPDVPAEDVDPEPGGNRFPWGWVLTGAGVVALVWWLCRQGWLPGCQGAGAGAPGPGNGAARQRRQQQQADQARQQAQLQRRRQQIAQRLQGVPPIPPVQREAGRPIVLRYFPSTEDPDNMTLPWATEVIMPDGRAVFVHGYQQDPRIVPGQLPDMELFEERLTDVLQRVRGAYPETRRVAIEDYRSPATGQAVLSNRAREWFERAVAQVYPRENIRFRSPAEIERMAPRPPQTVEDLIDEMDAMYQTAAEGQMPPMGQLSRVFAGTPEELGALTPSDIFWNRAQLYTVREIMEREGYRFDRPGRYDTGDRRPGATDVEYIVLQHGPEGAFRIQLPQEGRL